MFNKLKKFVTANDLEVVIKDSQVHFKTKTETLILSKYGIWWFETQS